MHDVFVESASGICVSKWRILDKAIETIVDTGVDIVKRISLLHNIIIDFEDYCCLHSRVSQHNSLSLRPTRATREQRTNKLVLCYQPERPFCTLTRYTLRRRTAPTYIHFVRCGRETRVHAGRWHAGQRLMHISSTIDSIVWATERVVKQTANKTTYFFLLSYFLERETSHTAIHWTLSAVYHVQYSENWSSWKHEQNFNARQGAANIAVRHCCKASSQC